MSAVPPLPAGTILLVEVGSTAHGIGLAGGQDRDEMGVVVERPEQVLGFDAEGMRSVMHRTQPEGVRSGPGDVDRTVHSVRRFVRLGASGNPSVLLALWAPVVQATEEGHQLQTLGDAFVGRHVIPRYRGYLRSQAERLLGIGAGSRGGKPRPELVARHGFDTKYATHCARLGFQGIELLDTGRLELPMTGEPAEWLQRLRRGEVPVTEWWERAVDLDAALEARSADESIPSGPDTSRIEAWVVDLHLAAWASR